MSTSYFDNCWRRYKINSVRPNRLLETQFFFEKKGILSSGKKNCTNFSGSSILTNIWGQFIRVRKVFWLFCGSYKTISLTTKRLLKPHVFENKFKLSSEEKILAYFFGNTEWHKPQGTIFKGPKGFLTKTMEGVRSFLYDLTGCWKHKFLKKKGKLSGERKNLA